MAWPSWFFLPIVSCRERLLVVQFPNLPNGAPGVIKRYIMPVAVACDGALMLLRLPLDLLVDLARAKVHWPRVHTPFSLEQLDNMHGNDSSLYMCSILAPGHNQLVNQLQHMVATSCVNGGVKLR